MDPYILDWLNLLARWFHIVVGAAWIGTSFYFNWLNNHIRPPEEGSTDQQPAGLGGELWAVHGGAFYQVRKYKVAPERLPRTLHWFKWEAYLTWVSGVSLLSIVYYMRPEAFMLDSQVSEIGAGAAVGLGVGTLVLGWLGYDLLCKSPLRRRPVFLAVLGFVLVVGVAYGLCQVLNPRAAYIHVGAMLGTCMAANVFFVIIPGQRAMVDAMKAGKEPDPAKGLAGSLRSRHNNYLTLPVLFIMVSNHYPATFGHEFNWAILAALVLISAGVRHWFNLRGMGQANSWILPVAAVAMVALAFAIRPQPAPVAEGEGAAVPFSEARAIITERCVPCHAQQPSYAGFVAPPNNITFETPEAIQAQAQAIQAQAVSARIMPLGNLTQITEEERATLGRWIAEGASIEE